MSEDGLYWIHFNQKTKEAQIRKVKASWVAVAVSIVWMLSVIFAQTFGRS